MIDSNKTRNKVIILTGLSVLALLLIFFIPRIKNKNGNVNITTIPKDATVTINGKKSSKGKQFLLPGDYTLRASKEGFKTEEKKVVIKSGDGLRNIYLFPEPESDEALAWAQKNPKLQFEKEGLAGEQSQLEGQSFRDTNPLVDRLPYRSLIFNMDYALSEKDATLAVIKISASSGVDRSYAIAQIRDWGYEPGDYLIEFTDFTNPLGTK
jgi:hypothetical protein